MEGSGTVVRLRVFSCLDLACLDLSAWRSGQEGIVPLLHLNLKSVLMQSSRRSKASRNLFVAMYPILSLWHERG